MWDTRAQFRPTRFLAVWLKGTNPLDMNYHTRYGFPDRGIAGWLGVRVTIH